MNLREILAYKPVELAFGTSGLRGLVTDMTDLECYINVSGFFGYLQEHDDLKQGDTIFISGDLRQSTPRIMRVVAQAALDLGLKPVNCGFLPTPALAYYGMENKAPSIMVTGSHIPSDRNGIKFYKRHGEVLKSDETSIRQSVAECREQVYAQSSQESFFLKDGAHKSLCELGVKDINAEHNYVSRYTDVFDANALEGKKIVVYQHSAVGRDLIVKVLEAIGATVTPALRSEKFVPIDSENVTAADMRLFQQLASSEPGIYAVVSTDGDSDRPFVIDESGVFYRGDVLGCIVAKYLSAGFAAIPVSSNDAVDIFCNSNNVVVAKTKIGSPYVIDAMQQAVSDRPIVGWEVNGGFLLGSPVDIKGKQLKALPTRDALLPILCALLTGVSAGTPLSKVFSQLPERYTGGGLIDNIDPSLIVGFNAACSKDDEVQRLVSGSKGLAELGTLDNIDTTDGLKLYFSNGETVHLRPSGNAPQFRVYTNADSQARADELVGLAIDDDGYIMQLLSQLTV